MKQIKKSGKKTYVSSGFLSKGGICTSNAVNMYLVYLRSLPKDWNPKKLYPEGVQKVREFFGVESGLDVMIYWGINYDCNNSHTSSDRHKSMRQAYIYGEVLFKGGVIPNNQPIHRKK
jgi:hypothetical protein